MPYIISYFIVGIILAVFNEWAQKNGNSFLKERAFIAFLLIFIWPVILVIIFIILREDKKGRQIYP